MALAPLYFLSRDVHEDSDDGGRAAATPREQAANVAARASRNRHIVPTIPLAWIARYGGDDGGAPAGRALPLRPMKKRSSRHQPEGRHVIPPGQRVRVAVDARGEGPMPIATADRASRARARERDTACFFAVTGASAGLGFGSSGPSTRTLRGSKSGCLLSGRATARPRPVRRTSCTARSKHAMVASPLRAHPLPRNPSTRAVRTLISTQPAEEGARPPARRLSRCASPHQ